MIYGELVLPDKILHAAGVNERSLRRLLESRGRVHLRERERTWRAEGNILNVNTIEACERERGRERFRCRYVPNLFRRFLIQKEKYDRVSRGPLICFRLLFLF